MSFGLKLKGFAKRVGTALNPIKLKPTTIYGSNNPNMKGIQRPEFMGNARDSIGHFVDNARMALFSGTRFEKPTITRGGMEAAAYRNKAINLSQGFVPESNPSTFTLNKSKLNPINQKKSLRPDSMLGQSYGGAGSYKV